MSRINVLFTVAAFAFLIFLLQTVSGSILWLALDSSGRADGPGFGVGSSGEGKSTFIFHRHTWIDIHDWTSVALLAIIAIHLWLHRKWLYRQIRVIFGVQR